MEEDSRYVFRGWLPHISVRMMTVGFSVSTTMLLLKKQRS